jgi:hypothetical protein
MIDPLTGIEGKKWLSKEERAAIKTLKPYKGGNDTIWPLHQLDIIRKHERLICASVDIRSFRWETGQIGRAGGYMTVSGFAALERLKDKTILSGASGPDFLAPLDMAESHTHVTAHITFNEADLGLADHEVATTLSRFAARVAGIIRRFDA